MAARLILAVAVNVALTCVAPAPGAAAVRPGAAAGASNTPTLYVLASGTTSAQHCKLPSPSEEQSDAASIQAIVEAKLARYVVARIGAIDATQLVATNAPVLVASYCKSGEVLSVTVNGYQPVKGALPNSGTVSGTIDALWAADWSGIFGAAQQPLAPNVGFYAVANDTNNIVNPRLERNLPLTQFQTPGPAPTPSPPPGMASIPVTRFDACRQSYDHVLISGRIIILSSPTGDDFSKLLVGGAALKQSAPNPWGPIYAGLGVGLSTLYGPNRAEVGADVFVCPSDNELYWVGGQSITGHATTPFFNPSPEQIQRALDLATTDLENQLACVLHHEPVKTGSYGPTIPDLRKDLTTWCDGDAGYWKSLLADAARKYPSITIDDREPGPSTFDGPVDAGAGKPR